MWDDFHRHPFTGESLEESAVCAMFSPPPFLIEVILILIILTILINLVIPVTLIILTILIIILITFLD